MDKVVFTVIRLLPVDLLFVCAASLSPQMSMHLWLIMQSEAMLLYGAVPITPAVNRFMSSAVGVGQMHKDNNTLLYMTVHSTEHRHAQCEGLRAVKKSLTLACGVFRWFRGGDQETKDHHHRQTAGDPQKCLQKLAEARTPRQRAAVIGDGVRHESGAGRVFWLYPAGPWESRLAESRPLKCWYKC